MKTLKIALAIATLTLAGVGAAEAGCSPACKDGEVCRYEATTKGKFYCAPGKGVKGIGGKLKPAETLGSGAGGSRFGGGAAGERPLR